MSIRQNTNAVANIHVQVALDDDIAGIIKTYISEEFDVARLDDLRNLWLYFRCTDEISVSKYGRPVDNFGRPLRCPNLDDRLSIMLSMVTGWFAEYISLDRGEIPIVLRILAPHGGIYIRRVLPTEGINHKFVTADLPPGEAASMCVVLFEFVPSIA